tara:strand:- start:8085 stop:9023 length:939 start_codon:yes stop_codon:yes gene_type:complete
MSLITWSIALILAIIVLVKSSDHFTDRAEKIGLHHGLQPFVVGVIIVSIGTSLPEFVSSLVAVLRGSSEIVIGNVVGSNITNICLVLGLSAIIIKKIKLTYGVMHVDLPLLMATAFLLAVTIWDGVFTFFEALLCVAAFLLYLMYTIHTKKTHPDKIKKAIKSDRVHTKADYLVLLISTIFIYFSAEYVVKSVINISQIVNIGTEIIAVSAVALGTSLPELAVSIDVIRKGKPEIAVGNVLGSNIFNATFVMGIPALFGNLNAPPTITGFALPLMLIATILTVFMMQEREMTKWEGWMLILFYIFFVGKLFL